MPTPSGIVSIREQFNRESTQDRSWARTYSRQFVIVTDDPWIGANAIRAALPVGIGQFYLVRNTSGAVTDFDGGSFCTSISLTCDAEDGMAWTANAEYGPYDATNYPQDVTQWVPRVAWSFAQFQRDLDQDINGNAIVNSAGVPFNPTIKADDSRPILQLVRNEPTFDLTLAEDFRDTVNQNVWWGYNPRCVKVSNISSTRQFNQDIGFFWETTYEFHINENTWDENVLDAGVMQLNGSGSDIVPISKNGIPVPDPVPLNGSGAPLSVGGTPNYLTFQVYPTSDFSKLNFDLFYEQLTGYSYSPPGP